MAIASVARKATIREDRSLRDALQIVEQQKQVGKRLELEAQKEQSKQLAAKQKQTSDNLNLFMKTKNPELLPYANQFDTLHKQTGQSLLDPNKSQAEKQKLILRDHQFSQLAETAANSIDTFTTSIAGTAEQQKTRNLGAVTNSVATYITDKKGEVIPLEQFNDLGLADHVNNDIATYNLPNIVNDYMKGVKETVATEINSKNIANSMFSQNDIVQKNAQFLVLNDAGTDYVRQDGKPVVNITDANLEAFEEFNKGLSLALDEQVAKGADRKDAMENILKDNGFLTVNETRKTDIRATPTVTDGGKARGVKRANASDRVAFYDQDLPEGGENILAVLRTTKGVTDKANVVVDGETVPMETGVTDIDGGKRFTFIVDKNRLVDIDRVLYKDPETGEEVKSRFSKDKTGKFVVTTIDVLDDNPLPGLIRVNAVHNLVVPSKDRIDPTDFVSQYQRAHENDEVIDLGFN